MCRRRSARSWKSCAPTRTTFADLVESRGAIAVTSGTRCRQDVSTSATCRSWCARTSKSASFLAALGGQRMRAPRRARGRSFSAVPRAWHSASARATWHAAAAADSESGGSCRARSSAASGGSARHCSSAGAPGRAAAAAARATDRSAGARGCAAPAASRASADCRARAPPDARAADSATGRRTGAAAAAVPGDRLAQPTALSGSRRGSGLGECRSGERKQNDGHDGTQAVHGSSTVGGGGVGRLLRLRHLRNVRSCQIIHPLLSFCIHTAQVLEKLGIGGASGGSLSRTLAVRDRRPMHRAGMSASAPSTHAMRVARRSNISWSLPVGVRLRDRPLIEAAVPLLQ